MRRHRYGVIGAVLLCMLMPRLGHAEGEASPLAELRAAAEALADVEPVESPLPPRSTFHDSVSRDGAVSAKTDGTIDEQKNKSAGKGHRSELREAILGAVRAEIVREAMGRPSSPVVAGRRAGGPKFGEAPDGGKGDTGPSGNAALAAQQARQNQAVSQAKRAGKGESLMTGKQLVPPMKDSAGRPQATR